MNAVKNYLSLMRVKHYVKNVLVFIPLLFSRQLFQPGLFLRAFLGFLSFSMAISLMISMIWRSTAVTRSNASARSPAGP